jgi:polysaccharide pyruvyl transferase WcaK-like protein
LVKIKEDKIQIDNVIPANIKGAPRPSLSWALQNLHRKMFYANLLKQDYLHRRYYKEADVVISIGGDNFSDDYGSPERFFRTLDVAKKYGAKTVIWGASIGPFSPVEAEREWTEYLRGIDLITVREDKTVEYLTDLGISTNVQRVCDPAFLLLAVKPKIPIPFENANDMKIGIGMSALVHRYQFMERYLDTFIGLIEYLVHKYTGEIVLVPHVIEDKITRNDYAVCQEIARRLDGKCNCYVLPKTLNACEMKYCISNCDYFIGARTHSTIASLSSFVPTISVGYSVKAWGINRDLLGCDDYVVDIQSINTEILIDRFERLREHRGEIVRRLHMSVPRARENANRAGKYLLSMITGDNRCRR